MNHTPSVSVRNIVLGEGIPKICIPLVSTCLDALLNDIKKALDHSADLIEWRVDWMDDIFKEGYLEEILPAVRKTAGDTPLLFTFRTKKEGGNMAASLLQYKELVKRAICSGLVDLVDIELFSDKDTVNELIALAKEKNVKTILSNHDFFKTPSGNEIFSRLKQMEEAGADIAKIAVMPESTEDVLTLLSATCKAKKELTCPVITMSMAGESRTDQPLKRGSIRLLPYLWHCRKYFRTRSDRCIKTSFCPSYPSRKQLIHSIIPLTVITTLCNDSNDFLDLQRFGKIGIHTCIQAFLHIFRKGIGCHCNNRDRFSIRPF